MMIVLGFLSYKTTYSLFSDTAESTGNVFSASDVFPTATPTITPTPTNTPTITPTPTPQIAQTLVMNELLPLSSCDAGNTNGQFLELWNGSGATVNLQNFQLTDGTNTLAIANSNTSLANNAFAILVKSTGVIQQCIGNVNGAVTVNLGGTIDLNTNLLRLLDANSNVIDTIQWNGVTGLNPAIDQSIERNPDGLDSALGTNFSASDFVIQTTIQPGL